MDARPLVTDSEYGPPKIASRPPSTPVRPKDVGDWDSQQAGGKETGGPESPPVVPNQLDLSTGFGLYKGYPVQLKPEQLKIVQRFCIMALQVQFDAIVKELENDIKPNAGRESGLTATDRGDGSGGV